MAPGPGWQIAAMEEGHQGSTLGVVWERGTAPDGKAYFAFVLSEHELAKLVAGEPVQLDPSRLGLGVHLLLTTGLVSEAVRAVGLVRDVPPGGVSGL